MKIRQQRYREFIKEKLGKILFNFLETEPGVLATITRTEVSDDLLYVTVWISVFPSSKAEGIMKQIQRSAYAMQGVFNRQVRMKPIPKIRWEIDKKPEEAGHIEELIEETKKNEQF